MDIKSTPINVLVVDDEQPVCQSVDKVLTRRGHRVEQARSVATALRIIEDSQNNGRFDLIIADLMMPQAGGIDLLKVTTERWPEIPVLIITGYASIASAVEATRLGAVGYVPKPFTPEELEQAVSDAILRRTSNVRRFLRPITPTKADLPKERAIIDVDMPFDPEEVARGIFLPEYVQRLTRSDMPLIDFCSLGQRACKRFRTKGVCQAEICPVVSAQRKRALYVPSSTDEIADQIDVDMPFSARELASLTSESYVAALGRSDLPVVGHWHRTKKHPAGRILAVDDEVVVVNSVRRILSRRGYTVEEAFTCKTALARLMAEAYDLVLLDLRMPDMNGLELLSNIKKHRPELPVVIVTGYASIETAVDAIQRGATDYLAKPFTPEELYQVTSRALLAA